MNWPRKLSTLASPTDHRSWCPPLTRRRRSPRRTARHAACRSAGRQSTRRARSDAAPGLIARPRRRSRGAHEGRDERRPAPPPPTPRAGFYKDAAVAHELGPRRELARHRGAPFMGPAALPRWPLALASRCSRAWGSPSLRDPITRPMQSCACPARALHFPPLLVRAAAPAARTPWSARPAPGAASSTAAIEEDGQSRPFLVLGAEYISRVDRLPHAHGAVLLPLLPATGTPPAPQRPRG